MTTYIWHPGTGTLLDATECITLVGRPLSNEEVALHRGVLDDTGALRENYVDEAIRMGLVTVGSIPVPIDVDSILRAAQGLMDLIPSEAVESDQERVALHLDIMTELKSRETLGPETLRRNVMQGVPWAVEFDRLLEVGRVIPAIKAVRAHFQVSLKEAKDLVERYRFLYHDTP